MTIEEALEFAHIQLSNATFKVIVKSLKPYEVLFQPQTKQIEEDVFEIDEDWRKELNFPDFVISVTPWYEDETLSVWVTYGYDLKILSDWLKTFEL